MTWHAAATLAFRNAEGALLRTIAFVPDPAGPVQWRHCDRPDLALPAPQGAIDFAQEQSPIRSGLTSEINGKET
jgi:hypothetical protein